MNVKQEFGTYIILETQTLKEEEEGFATKKSTRFGVKLELS